MEGDSKSWAVGRHVRTAILRSASNLGATKIAATVVLKNRRGLHSDTNVLPKP